VSIDYTVDGSVTLAINGPGANPVQSVAFDGQTTNVGGGINVSALENSYVIMMNVYPNTARSDGVGFLSLNDNFPYQNNVSLSAAPTVASAALYEIANDIASASTTAADVFPYPGPFPSPPPIYTSPAPPAVNFRLDFQATATNEASVYITPSSFAPVPLPSAGVLLLSGLCGLGALRSRRATS
jgi:hypothetical protein